jgi:phenylpropionate dioxygenase-like ring-hydroxylating dioxygenase large terminal subunit
LAATEMTSLTESEAAGIERFDKPAPGNWTEAFGLDTGPVDLRDSYDPDFFDLEKEAVFRRSWLYVGRTEQLPRKGTYFTKEYQFLGVSVLVIRGMDDEIRAFHNVCSHRGNKLMWDEFPGRESHGACRQLACKYHGWRYDLDGSVSYVHNAPEFFSLRAEDLSLPKISCEVFAGFVFINLEQTPRQSLGEFLGPEVLKLESYPFHKMTQRYVIEGEVESNWKILMDAFQELYHVPYVHSKMNNPGGPVTGTDKVPFMIPAFRVFGKHRVYTSGGPLANEKVRSSRPLDDYFGSSFYGPTRPPEIGPIGDGVNPGRVPNWGLDSWQIYPNLDILIWGHRNWYLTYEYWPLTPDTHRFVWNLFFVPPTNARDRLAQEQTLYSVREFAIQDAGAVAAMQAGLRSGARDDYYFCDQEVLARHLHHCVQSDVSAYKEEVSKEGPGGGGTSDGPAGTNGRY